MLLSALPKPLLFGLYGAVSGFFGAFCIAEPLYDIILETKPIDRTAIKVIAYLLLMTAVWSAAIVTPISLGLLAGQNHYLRGSFPHSRVVAAGFFGGIAVGVTGGIAGQVLFFFAPQNNFAINCLIRIFSWAILGGLSGAGLSLFIPNMKRALGLAGGSLGGAVGCVGFIAITIVTHEKLGDIGETIGRLVGGTMLGFCIGLMVVAAETMFRRAWLEVRYGSRETITVTLGPEPVKVGGDAKACTVWARGAKPVALRFFVRDGQVICDDRVNKCEIVAEDDYSQEVGNVTVTVHLDRGTGRRKKRSHISRPVAKPVPMPATPPREDDDDWFDLPMPVSPTPSPPPRPSVATPPVSPPPPQPRQATPPVTPPPPPPRSVVKVPKEPTPSLPPPVPIPSKSTVPGETPKTKLTKDPDACPSCGRKNPGRRGARYCMVCDQMY
jgi:hypothetical protein